MQQPQFKKASARNRTARQPQAAPRAPQTQQRANPRHAHHMHGATAPRARYELADMARGRTKKISQPPTQYGTGKEGLDMTPWRVGGQASLGLTEFSGQRIRSTPGTCRVQPRHRHGTGATTRRMRTKKKSPTLHPYHSQAKIAKKCPR